MLPRSRTPLIVALSLIGFCSADLAQIHSGGPDSCKFAKDGHCDEPFLCGYYTDCTDCGTCSSDVQISQQPNGTLLQGGALNVGAYPTGVDLYVSCLSEVNYINGTWTPDPDWVDKDCLPGAAVAERKIKSMFCFTDANERATQCTCWRLLDSGMSVGADCHSACGLPQCRSGSQELAVINRLRAFMLASVVLPIVFMLLAVPALCLKRRHFQACAAAKELVTRSKGIPYSHEFHGSGPGGSCDMP